MASKKPLLSPIPEIPEVFSFVSSPDSPKANALLSGDVVFIGWVFLRTARLSEENSSSFSVVSCLKPVFCGFACIKNFFFFFFPQFSTIVPDAKCGSDPSDCFQQAEETACVKEAEEPDFLIENKKLQENLLNKAEQLTRIKFLEQEDIHVHKGAQRTWCPQEDSVRGSPSRRRSGAICFPPLEKLKITGNNLPVSSFNIEEVLSVPQLKNDSFEPFRRKNDNSGEKRVRRSMRLHKDAVNEGLAWVQIPSESQERPPLLGPARRTRRTISTSILTASENIHPSEQNLTQFSAPGKENNDSVRVAGGPCKRWRRKSVSVSTPQETRTSSQTHKRSITKSVYRKDRSKQ
ncbi:CDCA2 protein, partial [Halcyon senegalensis]|nr:CDCA2 protein [Halcyon senegalensis]